MNLSFAIKSFKSNPQANRFLEKEMIIACLRLCNSLNSENKSGAIEALAMLEFVSKSLTIDSDWNEKIYNKVHELENVHIHGRSADS